MGHKHTRDEILDGAVATAFEHGLSRLSYGRVAQALGISDRVVVYYFPTKDDLVSEVLLRLGHALQATLGPAFGSPVADHLALARTAWPHLARPEADRVFALFFEANGLAAAGLEPYGTVVPQLVELWVAWAAELLSGRPDRRRSQAGAAIALLDGLLLLRQLAGPEAAAKAARVLDVDPG